MPSELPLNAGTLPAPYTCWQTLYNLMFSLGSADGPALTGLLIQDAVPAPEDHDKGWIPTSGGVPRYSGYVFVWNVTLGHWVSRHYIDASDPSRRIYVGTSASVATYDGGDGGAPGPASGPVWEIDTAFAGSVPIGIGLIPGSSPAASIVNPLDTQDSLGNSGEYKHVLSYGEMRGHFHGVGTDGAPDGNDPPIMISRTWNVAGETPNTYTRRLEDSGGSGHSWVDDGTFADGTMGTTNPLASGTASDGHLNVQPFVGVFYLKRTSRIWIVAA